MNRRPTFQPFLSAWRGGLPYEVFRSGAAFCILTLAFFLASLLLPQLREGVVKQLLALLGNLELVANDGTISVLGLFANNAQACIFIMLYGLIPFLRLPALTLGVNAMMLGVLAAWYQTQGLSLLVYLALILPHGIFELPAMVFSAGVGLYICGQLSRRIQKDAAALPLSKCLLLLYQALFFIFPLLLLAAFIEGRVTPMIASFLLS